MSPQGQDDRAAKLKQAIALKRAAARQRAAGGTASPPSLPKRPDGEPARLSEFQRSLWVLHELDPKSAAYNVASCVRIHSAVDREALQAAATQVIARHRILRSTFRADGESAVQEIAPPHDATVHFEACAASDQQKRAETLAQKPFDLGAGPLLRLTLLEDAEAATHSLLLVLHHILADEESVRLLWLELDQAYRGEPLPGEDATPQFDDYAAGEERSPRQDSLEFWERELRQPPESFRSPFAAPEPHVDRGAGHFLERVAPPALAPKIRKLASAHGTTPNAVYAFAYRLLLHRYSGGAPVAFATPSSRRKHPATQSMIGYFLNSVVLHHGLDEERSASENLQSFEAKWRSSLDHGDVPFDRLVEHLDPPRKPGEHPLFQTMFVAQSSAPPRFGAEASSLVPLDLGVSKFDVTLFVDESGASLDLALEFNASVLTSWQAGLVLEHYENLLAELCVDDGQRPLSAISVRSAEERSRLEELSAGSPLRDPAPQYLPERIGGQLEERAECEAVTCGTISWTYRELDRAVQRIAASLQAKGVSEGDRVALHLSRSCELIAALLAVHHRGAAYVPLDPAYPEARNHAIAEDAQVRAIVLGSEAQGGDANWRGPSLPEVRSNEDDPAKERIPQALIAPDSSAYLLYTSGSTGRPKGVVVSHQNLAFSNAARDQVYGTEPQRFLLLSSVAFDSSVAGLFSTLANGGTLVLPQDEEATDSQALAALIERQRVTMLLCVPSLYAALLAESPAALRTLRIVIVAGESCPSALVRDHFERLPSTRLFNEYGPTEATVWASVHEFEARSAGRPTSIGRPIPGVIVEVRDDHERPAPLGVLGQAWVVGPTVTSGYWNRSELTEERFRQEAAGAAYATGDLVSWTEEGTLLFHGRGDEQIKVRGVRIEPGEIESALLELPGVEQAVVVARDSAAGSTQLVAYLVGETLSEDGLARSTLDQRLPAAMIPARSVLLSELPHLPNGKVDRAQLRQLEIPVRQVREDAGHVATSLEESLRLLWQSLLGVEPVGLEDNLFELGGHSLLVVEMARVLKRDLGAEITPADVFQNPTIRALAKVIEKGDGSQRQRYAHLFPIQPRGSKTPILFCIPHFFSSGFAAHYRGVRPVYGLRGVGLRPEGNLGRWRDMEALAEEICAEIKERFGSSPCILAGYSFGGSMAFETARLLTREGIQVEKLILIAPMPLDFHTVGPLRLQLDALRSAPEDLSAGEMRSALWRSYGPRKIASRLWRGLGVKNYRRLLRWSGKRGLARGEDLSPRVAHADVRLDRFSLHSRYAPEPISVPTLFFNGDEPETDAAATWKNRFEGPLEILVTPDPHEGEDAYRLAQEEILRVLDEELS